MTRLDIVLVGPPGAGKGTQASLLCAREQLIHLSTGDLLRQAIATGTELGRQVQGIVDAGRLVPDKLVLDLVEDRLGGPGDAGVLFDGFPRTVRQAEMLGVAFEARTLGPPLAVQLVVPDDEVVRRLGARRTCAACGPRAAGESTCTGCGQPLAIRADDREGVIRERLRVYSEQTAPLCEWYGARGLLRVVDGLGSAQAIAGRIATIVDEARPPEEANR